jgi:hypothetical protein
MKNKALFILLLIATLRTSGQTLYTEDFNSACSGSTSGYPAGWSEINSSTNPAFQWHCTPAGRSGTPGMVCSALSGDTAYVDTAWLFTPPLTLSKLTGNAYLNFDAKFSAVVFNYYVIVTDSSSVASPDTISHHGDWSWWSSWWSDLADSSRMGLFIDPDTSTWKTYSYDITAFKTYPSVLIAFFYTSNAVYSGTWTIDNVNISSTPLSVSTMKGSTLPLAVVSTDNSSQITIDYHPHQDGRNTISVVDMLGRTLYSQNFDAVPSKSIYSFTDMHLAPGAYIVRVSDGTNIGYAKMAIGR